MGFFERIRQGLSKTRHAMQSTIGGMFAGFHGIDDDFYDDLEESLILADLGVDTAVRAVEELRERVRNLEIPAPHEEGSTLSISQGIRNSIPSQENKLWDYLYTADNALYQVKKTQKGDICLLKDAKISDLSLRKGHIL